VTSKLAALAPPDAATTIAVLLGASEYPRKSVWSNPVLCSSAHAFRDYIQSEMGFALPPGQVLDLFDSELDPTSQLIHVGDFLAARTRTATDLVLYYVGHGGFHHDDYHLGIRCTQADREFITTLESRKLAQVIRREFGRKRVYVILDSCFSASAASDWQGSEIEAAVRKMAQPLPGHGTAFLAAASKYDVTRAPRDERYTRFTGAILEALTHGIDSAQPKISLYELYEEVRSILRRREIDDAGRPELHLPNQAEGDVSRLQLFPNVAHLRAAIERARERAAALRAEEETTRAYVRDGGAPSTSAAAPRRRSALLVAAVVMAAVAGGVTIVDRVMLGISEAATAEAFAAAVEQLALAFDAAAQPAHLRADALAAIPMLRAAIELDAASMNDLVSSGALFAANPGEVLEVFQFSGAGTTSLLRMPRSAPSLQPAKGHTTRFHSDGRGLAVAVSAPIAGYRASVSGGLMLSTPVDLAPVGRALSQHAARASLTGLGSELPLVDSDAPAGAAQVALAIPSIGEWSAGDAALTAAPRPAVGVSWASPARYLSGGLALLLLASFGLTRRSHPAA